MPAASAKKTVWSWVQPWALTATVAALPLLGPACSGADADGGDPDVDAIAWVSPTSDAHIAVDDLVQLTVKVNDPSAKLVEFFVDGERLDACDTTNGPHECRRGDLFRIATKFDAPGTRRLTAKLPLVDGERDATLSVEVLRSATPASAPLPDPDADPTTGEAPDAGATPTPAPPVDRGFLDPDKPLHNVFGGVSWAVSGQRVDVVKEPSGSVTAVAACMKRYGASILKHADAHKLSRASVVATAITESNCTNPSGSSDGLSSGPMQVTGRTCRALVKGFASDAACKKKMHDDPDYSFYVGALVMSENYAIKQHGHDPPKIAATYNAGSVRSSSANRWHMVVTGNHLERYVGAYNAYRAWEATTGAAQAKLMADLDGEAEPSFAGESAETFEALPSSAAEGQVYFVGRWSARDGVFVTYRHGSWQVN